MTDVSLYPPFVRAVGILDAAVDRMCKALLAADSAKLDEVIAWKDRSMKLRDLSIRMVSHFGLHAGEIADLRRSLKLGSIFA